MARRRRKDCAYPPMLPNLDKYRPYLDDLDLETEQKDQLIESLWLIAESFVERAYGVRRMNHPDLVARCDSISNDNVINYFKQTQDDPLFDHYTDVLETKEDNPKTKT